MKRTIGRIATVGAVALVLAGTLATPAGARSREDRWNDLRFFYGGQPFIIYGEGSAPDEMICDYGDGYMTSSLGGSPGGEAGP